MNTASAISLETLPSDALNTVLVALSSLENSSRGIIRLLFSSKKLFRAILAGRTLELPHRECGLARRMARRDVAFDLIIGTDGFGFYPMASVPVWLLRSCQIAVPSEDDVTP